MGLKECVMVLMAAVKRGEKNQVAVAEVIVTAPSFSAAKKYAEKELEPFIPNRSDCLIRVKNLGKILFGPAPTTIFLYTQKNGQVLHAKGRS